MCKQPECVNPPSTDSLVEKAYKMLHQMGHTDVTKEEIKADIGEYVATYCDDIEENPRSHWNYRIIHRVDEWSEKHLYAMARVEYTNGEISGIDTSGPVTLISEGEDKLREIKERLDLAYSRPTLAAEDIEKAMQKANKGKKPLCNHPSCWEKSAKENNSWQ